MTDNTQASEELKSILGEMPNYIFDYLELSDDIRKEWKYGSNASDFGGHNKFVQQFTKRLEALIRTEKLKLLAEVRERVVGEHKPKTRGLTQNPNNAAYWTKASQAEFDLIEEQLAELDKLEAEL